MAAQEEQAEYDRRRELWRRRRKVRLSEEQVMRILQDANLPEGSEILAVRGVFDPPSIEILICNPAWPINPPDSEAPLLWHGWEYSDGRLSLTLSPEDSETPL